MGEEHFLQCHEMLKSYLESFKWECMKFRALKILNENIMCFSYFQMIRKWEIGPMQWMIKLRQKLITVN